MGGGYCGLAGSDVGECGCICHSSVSCIRGLSGRQLEYSRIAHVKQSGSFQFVVLRFGFLQDGNVGVGIFPEREKIPLSPFNGGFGGICRKTQRGGFRWFSGSMKTANRVGFVFRGGNYVQQVHRLKH